MRALAGGLVTVFGSVKMTNAAMRKKRKRQDKNKERINRMLELRKLES